MYIYDSKIAGVHIYIYIYIYIYITPNGSEEIYLGFIFPDHQDKIDWRG